MAKWVTELYGKHEGKDVYVVGTGPSLRVFPTEFLHNKITIGLNRAWESVGVRYGITIHPELNIPEYMSGESRRPAMQWITKFEKLKAVATPEQSEKAKKKMFFFKTEGKPNTAVSWQPSDSGRVIDWVRSPVDKHLYQWSSISQTAINLAANMGAKNIILVGCDGGDLGGNHHAKQQHTRWKGISPDERYAQYREGIREVASAVRERGVGLMSLTPFSALFDLEREFTQICGEKRRPAYLDGHDIPVAHGLRDGKSH
jgi:hypothetical protein